MCFEKTKNQRFSIEFDVTVRLELLNLDGNQFHPWIEFISHDYKFDYRGEDTTTLVIQKFSIINSVSPFLDDFNSTFDNYSGYNDYNYYLRLSDIFSNAASVQIDVLGGRASQSSRLFRYDVITNLFKEQMLILNVYNCSPSYDKYLKSTMQDFLNNEFLGTPLPFSGPVRIFSNIINGVGIFAAYSPKSTQVGNIKCN